VQQALTPTTTMTISYVGSIGRHLVTGINNPDMPQAITIGGQQGNGFTPAPHLSGQFWMSWSGASSYNSLQTMLQKHFSHGLSFMGSYTWAHAFDNTVDMLGGDYGSYKQAALIPIRYEWGQSGYDIRHRAVINVDYDLPFGKGQQWLNHGGVLNAIVGGWKLDSEWWGQTGQPFTVGISRISGWGNANGGLANSAIKIGDPMASGGVAPNANATSSSPTALQQVGSGITSGAPSNVNANVCAAQTHTRTRWFNPCAFADPIGVLGSNNAAAVAALQQTGLVTGSFSYQSPAIGPDSALSNGIYSSLGQAAPYVTGYSNVAPFFGSPKNDVSGPGNWRLNASLFKQFNIWREGKYLELRVDSFNVLNHPSFGNPGGTSTNIGANTVALTGTMSNQNNTIDSRFLQFGGRFVF
jgi:hypothetical protein